MHPDFQKIRGEFPTLEVVRGADGRVSVESFLKVMDDRTRAVSVSWVAYGSGFRFDVPSLAEVCRDRGIILVVDGIQAVGVLATPLPALGADVVVAGGFKGLLSPAGTGFLYCREELTPQIDPAHAARFSFEIDATNRCGPIAYLG